MTQNVTCDKWKRRGTKANKNTDISRPVSSAQNCVKLVI